MKNYYFFVALIAVFSLALTGCNNGKKNEPVKQYEVVSSRGATDIIKNEAGAYGLRVNDSIVVSPEDMFTTYTNIEYSDELEVYKMYTDSVSFSVADANGRLMRIGQFTDVKRDKERGYYYFYNDNKLAVYSVKVDHSWGMYDEVIIENDIIFARDNNKWGAISLSENLYLERIYDKIYVVNYKSDTDFSVFALKKGEWSMYDAKGALYDTPSSEISSLVARKKTKSNAGVLDIKF